MIAATPIKAPHPVAVFLKPSSKDSSTIATVACSRNADTPCSIPVHVGLFFDGTNNNMSRDRDGVRVELDGTAIPPSGNTPLTLEQASHSNVVKLYRAFPSDKHSSGYFSYYIAGVGTPFPEIGETTETDNGKAFAKGGKSRIIWGLLQVLNGLHATVFEDKLFYPADVAGALVKNYESNVGRVERDMETKQNDRITHRDWFEPRLQELKAKLASRPKPNIPSLTVSVFGFSRGAAEAVAFCHFFAELLTGGKLAGIPASIDFLGIFDTVASVGMSDSAGRTTFVPNALFDGHWAWANKILEPLPDCVKGGRHYIAAHEQRMNFPVTQIQSSSGDFKEVYFPGVHSDVGGGYGPGEYGKGRGGQSAMLSQIPLAHMFKEARVAGVPLRPFSQLESTDQDDFLIDAELASAWNAYTAELGTNGSLIKKHMELYYRWRAARLKTLESTASFKAASAQAQEDMRSSNNMLIGDLEAIRERSQRVWRRSADDPEPFTAKDLSRINQWHYYRAQQGLPLDKWEAWALGIFNKPEQLPPDVMRFFDDYVHDSLAGFYLAGAVTEFDKRKKVAEVKAMKPRNMSRFDKKVFAHSQKVEAAQAKAAKGQGLTKEETDLVTEAKSGTPFPIMTDEDTADMRSWAITTQTSTRREGGGYILRRSYYPKEGFFIRESIHEKELEKEPSLPVTPPPKDGEKPVAYEYVWSDDLVSRLALHIPDVAQSDRMVA